MSWYSLSERTQKEWVFPTIKNLFTMNIEHVMKSRIMGLIRKTTFMWLLVQLVGVSGLLWQSCHMFFRVTYTTVRYIDKKKTFEGRAQQFMMAQAIAHRRLQK